MNSKEDIVFFDELCMPLFKQKTVYLLFDAKPLQINTNYFFSPDQDIKSANVHGIEAHLNTGIPFLGIQSLDYPPTVSVNGVTYTVATILETALSVVNFRDNNSKYVLRNIPLNSLCRYATGAATAKKPLGVKVYDCNINLDSSYMRFTSLPAAPIPFLAYPFTFFYR